MTFKECEIAIKQGDPAVLEGAGIIARAPKLGYICIDCGSGSGDKGTGTRDYHTDRGYVIQKCFNCGKSHNNLELIAHAYNLELMVGNDYREAVKIGSELYGLELEADDGQVIHNHPRPKINVTPPKVYAPEEIVADSVKETVAKLANELIDKGIIVNRAPELAPARLYFNDEEPVEASHDNLGTTWRSLANSDKYDFKKDCEYSNRVILARYFGMKSGGDIADEFALYKKICSELGLEFKTKAQEKAERDAKIAVLVHEDIKNAIANIDNAPVDVRRGLPIEILKELKFGWLIDWRHPVNRMNSRPSRRLLATTPNHYEAMLPKSDRVHNDSAYSKLHTSPREPFFLDIIAPKKINFVFEGAVDAASAYYAFNRKYPCYATGGTSQQQIFIDALNKICTDAKKPGFVIMFDADEAGRKAAPEFKQKLAENGYPAVMRFITADVNKVDCNDILIRGGKKELHKMLEDCYIGVEDEIDIERDKIKTVKVKKPKSKKDAPIKDANRTRTIIPNCPIDLYVPTGFVLTKTAILKETKTGNITISSTPMVITRTFEDENRESGMVEISIFDHRDQKWHSHKILTEFIASNSSVLKLASYGAAVCQNDARWISKYLMNMLRHPLNAALIPNCKIYRTPGWVDAHCNKYIHPVSKDNSYVIGNGDFDYHKTYTQKGNKGEWLSLFIKNIRQSYVTRLVCGFALATPLILPCGTRNLQLHLCGRSGSGKTAVAKLAASIYGDPAEIIRSFNGTLYSLEDYSAKFNDGFHVINELQAKKKSSRDDEGDTFLYGYEEGKERSRLDRNSNQRKTWQFRGGRLSTGEQRLTKDSSGAGALARVLEISESEIIPDANAIELHNAFMAGLHGHFGRQWIEYIITHKQELIYEYEKLRDSLTDTFTDAHPSHVSMVALSYTALDGFAKLLGDAKFADFVKFAKLGVNSEYTKIFMQLPTKKTTENAERARDSLTEYLFSHSGNFVIEYADADGYTHYEVPKEHMTTVGYQFGDGRVGFLPHELKKILENEYQFPSADALIRDFAGKDWLEMATDAKHKYQKSLRAGKDRRVKWLILFKANVLLKAE